MKTYFSEVASGDYNINDFAVVDHVVEHDEEKELEIYHFIIYFADFDQSFCMNATRCHGELIDLSDIYIIQNGDSILQLTSERVNPITSYLDRMLNGYDPNRIDVGLSYDDRSAINVLIDNKHWLKIEKEEKE